MFIKKIFSECFGDIRRLIREEGIFPTALTLIGITLISILSLPIIPFELLNDRSKTWFGGRDADR